MSHVQSMTGFGKGEAQNEAFTVTVEMKSVNNRFKDIRFKMSSIFSGLEIELKEILNSFFQRGSFDIFVCYKRNDENARVMDLDKNKIKSFVEQMTEVEKETGAKFNFNPTDFLRSDFLVDQDDDKVEVLTPLIREAFTRACEALKEARIVEGEKLVKVLQKHRDIYFDYYSKIEGLTDTYQEIVTNKLKERFAEWKSEMPCDEPRFMQEVVFYLEKLDVHEEINRISSHLKKLDAVLASNGEVGRQIDFLVQELNRETNTLGSKSGNTEISDSVVQMKVQLEKIREQALNME